ncbi:hypothetical protein MP228_006219 [Amoeboaphelidium protococcarum]|nr:hypothetical protein MP228_006219 [Amoeboaphelidium protococcarum]
MSFINLCAYIAAALMAVSSVDANNNTTNATTPTSNACVDLSKSECGRFGISIKLPADQMIANVSAFNDFVKLGGKELSSGCENIDLSGVQDQLMEYSCLTASYVAYNVTSSNATMSSQLNTCNGNKNVTYSQDLIPCKSTCESFFQFAVAKLEKKGCSTIKQNFNSTVINDVCSFYPESNCKAIPYASSASNTIASAGVALFAMAATMSLIV